MAGREDEGDKRSREEHLDDGNVAVIAAEYSREWIGVIDSKALGCSNGQAAVILIEGNKVECRIGHGAGRCACKPGPDGMNRDVSVARARWVAKLVGRSTGGRK